MKPPPLLQIAQNNEFSGGCLMRIFRAGSGSAGIMQDFVYEWIFLFLRSSIFISLTVVQMRHASSGGVHYLEQFIFAFEACRQNSLEWYCGSNSSCYGGDGKYVPQLGDTTRRVGTLWTLLGCMRNWIDVNSRECVRISCLLCQTS